MQIDKDGWPRFENPISVKATDKVSARHQHVIELERALH